MIYQEVLESNNVVFGPLDLRTARWRGDGPPIAVRGSAERIDLEERLTVGR
jgi:hypothetical protein